MRAMKNNPASTTASKYIKKAVSLVTVRQPVTKLTINASCLKNIFELYRGFDLTAAPMLLAK